MFVNSHVFCHMLTPGDIDTGIRDGRALCIPDLDLQLPNFQGVLEFVAAFLFLREQTKLWIMNTSSGAKLFSIHKIQQQSPSSNFSNCYKSNRNSILGPGSYWQLLAFAMPQLIGKLVQLWFLTRDNKGFSMLLMQTGRAPNLAQLELEKITKEKQNPFSFSWHSEWEMAGA